MPKMQLTQYMRFVIYHFMPETILREIKTISVNTILAILIYSKN